MIMLIGWEGLSMPTDGCSVCIPIIFVNSKFLGCLIVLCPIYGEYIHKATNLLSQPVYRTIDKDPTNKLKSKLITLLRKLKRESGLEDHIYKNMYPMGCPSPKIYDLPKIHKTNTPLRPIVSSYLLGSQIPCQNTQTFSRNVPAPCP